MLFIVNLSIILNRLEEKILKNICIVEHWRSLKLLILLIISLGAIYIALPNFYPSYNNANNSENNDNSDNRESRHEAKRINLGLDLRGGASIILAIDFKSYINERLLQLWDEAKSSIEEKNFQRNLGLRPDEAMLITTNSQNSLNSLKITFQKNNININSAEKESSKASEKLEQLRLGLKKLADFKNLNISIIGDNLEIGYSAAELTKLQQAVVEDSIHNIQRRIDEFGVKEAVVYMVGQDKIAVELPGLQDPSELKNLIGRTAKLTFHLLAEDGDLDKIILSDRRGRKFPIKKKVSLSGELLSEASVRVSERGKAAIGFKFNFLGSQKFERLTKENVGKPFAIVLDDIILTAPVIREPIFGGQGEITGNFTMKEAKEIAVLLKSGALPAKLEVIEQRIIGPTLGAESIESAEKAGIAALILVMSFMIIAYRGYGAIAAFGLILNLIFILAILTFIQATLTLPGIAGLILTVGMAVDTNVLIFERIREEFIRTGVLKNSIFKGFASAKSTIIDANVTTLIAALIMLFIGSGPIKGFGVTLSIGIFSSMFTTIVITYSLIELFFIKRSGLTAKAH